MGSSKSKDSLYDPIRKKRVKRTPEEVIRQALLFQMIEQLGYPPALITVEKELSQLPHLSSEINLPQRRADILLFGKHIHPEHALFPLMLIECKAVPLTSKFTQQVVGYNTYVQAPYVVLANGTEVLTGQLDEKEGLFHFEEGLPAYHDLSREILINDDFQIVPDFGSDCTKPNNHIVND